MIWPHKTFHSFNMSFISRSRLSAEDLQPSLNLLNHAYIVTGDRLKHASSNASCNNRNVLVKVLPSLTQNLKQTYCSRSTKIAVTSWKRKQLTIRRKQQCLGWVTLNSAANYTALCYIVAKQFKKSWILMISPCMSVFLYFSHCLKCCLALTIKDFPVCLT